MSHTFARALARFPPSAPPLPSGAASNDARLRRCPATSEQHELPDADEADDALGAASGVRSRVELFRAVGAADPWADAPSPASDAPAAGERRARAELPASPGDEPAALAPPCLDQLTRPAPLHGVNLAATASATPPRRSSEPAAVTQPLAALEPERRYPFAHSNALGGVVMALVLIAIDSFSIGGLDAEPAAPSRARGGGPLTELAPALCARVAPSRAEPDVSVPPRSRRNRGGPVAPRVAAAPATSEPAHLAALSRAHVPEAMAFVVP